MSRGVEEDDASSHPPTRGDHAAVAVKRRDPCTKRRGDLRLSHLSPVSALEQSWTARPGPRGQRHAWQLGHGLRQPSGKGRTKKRERESKTASPSPVPRKVWDREIAVSNRLATGSGVSVARYGRIVTAALAGVPRPAPDFINGRRRGNGLGSSAARFPVGGSATAAAVLVSGTTLVVLYCTRPSHGVLMPLLMYYHVRTVWHLYARDGELFCGHRLLLQWRAGDARRLVGVGE